MSDPLQPPLPQPPNWGAYVTGEDTIGYYYQQEADTASTEEYFFEQKVSTPVQDSIFLAEVLAPITGANAPGDPGVIPGYTSGASTP